MLGEELEKLHVFLAEPSFGVGAENDANPDDPASPLDGNGDRGTEPIAVSGFDVPTGNLAVAVEYSWSAVRDNRSRDPLSQWENPTLLAPDAEVGLLAIGARLLIDRADRSRSRTQEAHRPSQDPLK
jgi:hypothetical protein